MAVELRPDTHDGYEERLAEWQATAATIDRLNRSDPRLGLETANAWLAREQAGGSPEGIARALWHQSHALRILGRDDEAIAQY